MKNGAACTQILSNSDRSHDGASKGEAMSDLDGPRLHSPEWFFAERKKYIAESGEYLRRGGVGVTFPRLHKSLPKPPSLSWPAQNWLDFCQDSMLERGRFLTGKGAHWCYEFDGMPIDETCPEWDACRCAIKEEISND